MSDSGLDALAAEQAVEAKLSESGADNIRRPFGDSPESTPDEGTPETPRNELGQFTTTESDPGDEQPDEVVAEETSAQHDDPAVQAYLNKYGGDVDAAIKGAAHLTGKMGEQANELGEMRRMVDELSNLSANLQAQNQPQSQYVDQATVDWYDQQVMENPTAAMEWARQQNNPLLVQRGLSIWKDIDPYAASNYTSDLKMQALQAQVQSQLAAAHQVPQETRVTSALQKVLADNPHFVNYDLTETLTNHPFAAQALQAASNSGDTGQIEGAIETLYSLAVGDTLATIARSGPTSPETVTTQDVATPTVSETRDPAPEPTNTEKFREAFRQESDRARKGVWVAD